MVAWIFFSSCVSYFRRDLRRVEIEMIEYCVDRSFAGILWWFLRFIQTAFPGLFHMVFVGVLWSLDNIDKFANLLLDGAYFPECQVVFVGLEKNFIARIEMFLMGRDGFLELCLPGNEFIEDGLDFSCEHCFWFCKFVLRVAIMEFSKTSVFLGMRRDKLSAWQIFLDVRNSIFKL